MGRFWIWTEVSLCPSLCAPSAFLYWLKYSSTLTNACVSIALIWYTRICPGMFLAENSIFTSIASLLYVFDILKAKDDNGTEIEPEVDYDGFIW